MASVKNFHHPGGLDPYPATDALNRLHPRSRRAALSERDGRDGDHRAPSTIRGTSAETVRTTSGSVALQQGVGVPVASDDNEALALVQLACEVPVFHAEADAG